MTRCSIDEDFRRRAHKLAEMDGEQLYWQPRVSSLHN
jgi:hypothetical protein